MSRSGGAQPSPRRTAGRILPTGHRGRADRPFGCPAAPRAYCRDGGAGHTDDTRGEWHEWHRNRPIAFTKLNINKDKIESLAKALAAGDSVAAGPRPTTCPAGRRTAGRPRRA